MTQQSHVQGIMSLSDRKAYSTFENAMKTIIEKKGNVFITTKDEKREEPKEGITTRNKK